MQTLLRMVAPEVSGPAAAASALRTPPTRQRAQRGETATGQAGPAQECAAIETAGLPRKDFRDDPRDAASERWRCVLLISTAASLNPDND